MFSTFAFVSEVGLGVPNGFVKLYTGGPGTMTPFEIVFAKAELPESGGFRFRIV